MNQILLDTSGYSTFKRGHKNAIEAIQRADEIYLNPIVLGELRAGFASGNRREHNENELREFLDSPRARIVAIDEDTSVFYAAIHQSLRHAGTPIPANDLWIAASAMQHGLIVVTADEHFKKVKQVILEFVDATS